ncbi:hypothetical protein L2E82_38609 [Cichorium intybus]|uniref:Uncharacterized protein n=1 Tax=Cichorium intybus TaxID=13427 RepID=A0ACB9AGI9_CICIN|nr:hypothetical protein L2E82_38609 [Cichorium intybus]
MGLGDDMSGLRAKKLMFYGNKLLLADKLCEAIKAGLKLDKNKVDLMKDSVFGPLASVTNSSEASATLIEALCKQYNSSKRCFDLNDKTYLSFCTRKLASILPVWL